jgi:hypothetical protein
MAKNRSAPTIQEIRAREEARRQARKRKPKVEHKQDMETYSLIIHLPEGADKANAYRGLQRADCLVPKFMASASVEGVPCYVSRLEFLMAKD